MKPTPRQPAPKVKLPKAQRTLLFVRDRETGKAVVIDSGTPAEMGRRVRFMRKNGGHDVWTKPDTSIARPAFQWRGPTSDHSIVRFDQSRGYGQTEQEVWVLPRTQSAYDALVEQGARAIFKSVHPGEQWFTVEGYTEFWRNAAKSALASIGIAPPAQPESRRARK
jgi:hypothetical protein